MNRFSFCLIVMTAVLLFSLPAAEVRGQEEAAGMNPSRPPVIRTHGAAALTVEPDRAEIQIGVATEDPSAQTAAQNNAAQADAVLKSLHELLGRDADIKTAGYSIDPVYTRTRNGSPSITHYRAVNIILVKTDQIKRVGEIIDRASQAGANEMQGLQFSLKDEAAVQLKALEQASREARAKADAIASALGVKIKRILEVEEIEQGPRPFFRNRAFAGVAKEAAATPVEAGTLDIDAAVTLTVEVIR
ncbi:MAG TPA: SIMPL domain-containing protein [Nitrospiria bacterium]|nr:SIMPL domain-containing protein [Nitrospiria bacterium]